MTVNTLGAIVNNKINGTQIISKGDCFMEIERAKQIYDSYGVIEVLYNGSPVWIESINGENVAVKYLQSGNRSEVPVKQLVETNHGQVH